MTENRSEITDRDNALFEAGIKLGALYHQFTGSPLSISGIASMEKAIRESIAAQPFVEKIEVKIDEKRVFGEINETFRYTELKGAMLDVKAVIRCRSARVFVSLKYDEQLNYPLMKIEQIETEF
ncbi:hypothetical protein MmiAt1_08580 [Methanimicrococcus sp. At1]|uniref:Dihydroneopterin aldolase n=2 Tax=Methanimicrococcus hacksteinii TaxID=3028293 RepID=A0ABU3VPE8_9EURY|nr:hypothetical protein [Methanimicrococcus sp. At1]